jgi:hemerythrin
MQTFEWNEECSVGIPELDAQHRHLVELFGEIVRRVHLGEGGQFASTALGEMHTYAEKHLQREELILRMRGYPGYEEHKAEHDDYRKKVAALQAQSARGDVGIRIANFLAAWWRFHILTSDREYARSLARQATAK